MTEAEFTQHLTDEQFGELMAGELAEPGVSAHLAACAHCRGEVAAVRESMGEFNAFSMAWALAEAPRRVPTPSRLALRLGGRPAWGLGLAATAAACLVAVGIGMPIGPAHKDVAQKTGLPTPTNAELAQDNQLLQSINQELRYDVQPAVPASELRIAVRHDNRRTPATVSN